MIKMLSQEKERITLTKAQVFKMVEELTSKQYCASNLVCDECPLGNIEGLNDCTIVYLQRRLEQLGKGE